MPTISALVGNNRQRQLFASISIVETWRNVHRWQKKHTGLRYVSRRNQVMLSMEMLLELVRIQLSLWRYIVYSYNICNKNSFPDMQIEPELPITQASGLPAHRTHLLARYQDAALLLSLSAALII